MPEGRTDDLLSLGRHRWIKPCLQCCISDFSVRGNFHKFFTVSFNLAHLLRSLWNPSTARPAGQELEAARLQGVFQDVGRFRCSVCSPSVRDTSLEHRIKAVNAAWTPPECPKRVIWLRPLKSSFHYKRQPAFFVRPFRACLRLRHDTGATFKFMQCEKT